MKIIYILLFTISSIFANVAIVSAFNGKAEIIRDGKVIDVKIGQKLENQDKIKTYNNTKLQLMFKDETIITIGKNAQFSILDYLYDEKNTKKVNAKFNFAKGFFRTVTGKIGKINPKKFNIKIKTASIGIRGTRFDIFVTPTEFKAALFQGDIYIAQNSKITSLLPGQMVTYKFTGEFKIEDGILQESKQISKKILISPKKVLILGDERIINNDVVKTIITQDSEEDLVIEQERLAEVIKKEKLDAQAEAEAKLAAEEAAKLAAEEAANASDTNTSTETATEETEPIDIESLTQAELDAYLQADLFTLLADYVTPTDIIDGYISDGTQARYNGDTSGIFTNPDGLESTETGNITIDIDFEYQYASYSISNMTNDASVYNGDYSDSETTDFTNGGFTVEDKDNSIIGKYYGSSAKVVAGEIKLSNENSKFDGTFISTKEPIQ